MHKTPLVKGEMNDHLHFVITGVYPGFTTLEWFNKLLPSLTVSEKPLLCIQEPGEILYVVCYYLYIIYMQR